jgi:uncharacterized membrane protein SpoIIM required for sporulation
MRERAFIARRQDGWEQLEALLRAADRGGLSRLSPDQLQELALRYRSATTDLAAAQSRDYSPEVRAYLNRLTARAHAYVYVGGARNGWSRLSEFFGGTFPREFRSSGRTIAACTTLFALAALVAYWQVEQRPLSVYALLPASLVPVVQKSLHNSNFAFDRSFAPAVASQIITNNVKVAMIEFAGGITLGVLTIWSLLQNGLMVGALGALYGAKGFGPDFWATIAPHGVIELTSIQIAAGAGILVAQAIIAPGRLRRIDALKANGRRAGVLMMGVAGLLAVAGTIEGFVTPQRTSLVFRFGFGILTAVVLAAYLALAGRKRGTRSPATRLLSGALVAASFFGASFGTTQAQQSNQIRIIAAAVYAPLLTDLASAYEANGVAPTVRESGYQDALKELDAGTADIAILDRAPAGSNYIDHPLAVVPYALVANSEAGVTALSSAQIVSIFSGKTTNWSQAGGANVPIAILERPPASGTTGLFDSVFGAPTAHGTLVDNTSRAVLDAVRETRGAIGSVGLAYAPAERVTVIAIDGALPTAEAIAAKQYRFYSYVHVVTAGPATMLASRFISFAETRRELLHKAGYLTVFETKTR